MTWLSVIPELNRASEPTETQSKSEKNIMKQNVITLDAEWLRPGNASKVFDVPRTTLYEWMDRDYIKSASWREDGQRHGKRLIDVQSIRDYIESRVVSGKCSTPCEAWVIQKSYDPCYCCKCACASPKAHDPTGYDSANPTSPF